MGENIRCKSLTFFPQWQLQQLLAMVLENITEESHSYMFLVPYNNIANVNTYTDLKIHIINLFCLSVTRLFKRLIKKKLWPRSQPFLLPPMSSHLDTNTDSRANSRLTCIWGGLKVSPWLGDVAPEGVEAGCQRGSEGCLARAYSSIDLLEMGML